MSKNIEDIVIEITKEGEVNIIDWPKYKMTVDQLIAKLSQLEYELRKSKL